MEAGDFSEHGARGSAGARHPFDGFFGCAEFAESALDEVGITSGIDGYSLRARRKVRAAAMFDLCYEGAVLGVLEYRSTIYVEGAGGANRDAN